MACLAIDDIVSQLIADKFGVLACFVAVFTFAYWMTLTRWLARKLKRLLPRGIYRNAADHRIETLNLEVKQIRSEMGALSPTAQFAAYFRKERVLNQLSAELSALIMERERNSDITSTLSFVVSGIFVQLIAVLLMFYSRNVVIGHINSTYFWPFNFLLYIPNFSVPMSGNNITEGTPVTLFSFLSLVTFVWQNAFSRTSRTKWKIL
uniref:Tail-anchored protein insertion receptor WRB n=1 Tax=Wuchereria bancrofti TaxID=6293 RepID=A0AAF5PSI7_WUCBA